MSTADFASYKAIVLADPSCSGDPTILKFLTETKNTWGPAVQGNMILIGTDPSYHFGISAGAKVLIDNAIKFSASGVSPTGSSLTGLYFALSCYYDSVDTATVDVLSYFGDFGVRGNLACYNNAHIVASSPALGTLDDAALSGWSCSVHEAFSRYPSVGVNGFQALAIAKDIVGDGSQTFGDGTIGLPYIISRGATPAGCGDGKWNAALGEECDDGNTKNGDGCSASCKCESGLPKGDGTCFPVPSNSTSSSRMSSSTMVPYKNATTTATVYETT
jgi:cysteine-rich repeat protein